MRGRGWFGDASSVFHILCTLVLLLLPQVRLTSPAIRSWRLRTSVSEYWIGINFSQLAPVSFFISFVYLFIYFIMHLQSE